MATPTVVFLSLAGSLLLGGILWEWLQGTAAYAGSDSDGGMILWLMALISLISAAGTNRWVALIFGLLLCLVFLWVVLSWLREVRTDRIASHR